MQLIGMLDSPYVRRVAVSLQLLGIPFEHRSLSVFRTFDQFRAINPVVKAPTLVCDDGTVLMDSTLILDYAEALAAPKSLMPSGLVQRQAALCTIGLALAACEKSVQLVYERNLRPPEARRFRWALPGSPPHRPPPPAPLPCAAARSRRNFPAPRGLFRS